MRMLLHRLLLILACLSGIAQAEEVSWKQAATRVNWWKTPRDYNRKFHPWTPPATIQEWEAERKQLRTQLLVSQGLWPFPEKPALQPVIHGKREFTDYTIEKVFFESWPGLYVTGNLYRPLGKTGPLPGILSPHGHWQAGRFYQADEQTISQQLEAGAETFKAAATSPLQARMVHLARMGCVVFHYDMIGYADHQSLDHRTAFTGVADALLLMESMGLQTWNSIRALDFLLTLPAVDASRIAVTGASGGGTQSFVLAAVDERIKVSVPAVMVSTDMQGGCVCENAPYLRIGLNNVSLAALTAPRPQGLIAANDWTLRIADRGYPELQQIYQLYGQPELIAHWVYPQFGHNYNQVSRQRMYEWLKTYLPIPAADLQERDFAWQSPTELTVFDDDHPRPQNSATPEQLRSSWQQASRTQLQQLSANGQNRPVLQSAAGVLLGGLAPAAAAIHCDQQIMHEEEIETPERYLLTRKEQGNVIPVEVWQTSQPSEQLLILLADRGTEVCQSSAQAESLRQQFQLPEATIITADIYGTGCNQPANRPAAQAINSQYYGYTSCYEQPYLTRQVQDLLTVLVGMQHQKKGDAVTLVGLGNTGLPVLLSQGVNPQPPKNLIADLQQSGFADIQDLQHPHLLPGALKYGGCGGLSSVFPAENIRLFGVNESLKQELTALVKSANSLELNVNSLTILNETKD